jgi:hypothetical protein
MTYAGAQYDGYIASGALNFGMDTAGRVAAHLCLRDIQRNFRGDSWDQNGPAVITRVLENLCGTKRVSVWSDVSTAVYVINTVIRNMTPCSPVSLFPYLLYFLTSKMEAVRSTEIF